MGGACSAYGGRGKAYRECGWGNMKEKKLLGRPRRRWENTVKLDLQEVGCEGTDWIVLAQDGNRWRALVNVVMNLRVS